MAEVESIAATITYYLEEVTEAEDLIKAELYVPKGDMTEAERKVKIDGQMAGVSKARRLLDGLKKDLKQKLIVGETILGFKKVELKSDRT